MNFKEGYYADVRIEDRSETYIAYRNGILEECKSKNEKCAFIRVYDGKMWYYASLTDTDGIDAALDELYAAAEKNPNILSEPTVKKLEVNRAELYKFRDCSVRGVSTEQKQALLCDFLSLLTADSCMVQPLGRYLDRSSEYHFISSLGADIKYDYQTCGVALICSLLEGERKLVAFWQSGTDRFDALAPKKSEAAASFAEQADYMRNSVPVEAGSYPVVLSPEAAGIFAHESFGHKSESDFMLSDESMKEEWRLGKKVGSSLLSIAEYGALPGTGYVPYDDEGTAAKKNYLIKNGILTGRLHSAQTASALDEELTGNARAVNCFFEPIVRMTNTYIEPGELSFDELIAPIKKGYFIKHVTHGSGMSTFTIAPHTAYEIIDGRLGRPVQISVISGNVFETLGLVDGLTDKAEMLSFVTGGCGKFEQYPLPVGFGGPYVRISSMKVQ